MVEPFGRGKYSKQLREADDRFRALENQCNCLLLEKDKKITVLVAALVESRSALIAFKDAVVASNKMNGREYVGLGIQINDAIDSAGRTLVLVSRSTETK